MARPPQTVANMVRSMIVVVIGTALIVIATLFKSSSEPAIDYRPTWSAAQRQINGFTPLAPKVLPQGWKAISVTSTPTTWNVGFRTSSGSFVGIEQGDQAEQSIAGAKSAGVWEGWNLWESARWRAMSQNLKAEPVVLRGDGSFAELQTLAKSLR